LNRQVNVRFAHPANSCLRPSS